MRVEEVAHGVVRIIVYRDEYEGDWANFVAKPGKYVVESLPSLQTSEGVEGPLLDRWDRQWLSLRFTKKRPHEADMYMICVRLLRSVIPEVLQASGKNALYTEPRTPCGRSPDTSGRVIWLNKKSKQQAMLAMQSTQAPTTLVRSGERFGLRCKVEDAATVHRQHKPTMPYIESANLQLFVVGPWPYGATRASLGKKIAQWGWDARALQPKSRSLDNKGTMWEVQASSKPQYEVYHMAHSDVLISLIDKPAKGSGGPVSDVQASAKTIAALSKPSTNKEDFLQVDDPWSRQPKVARVAQPVYSEDQIELIAAKVHKKVEGRIEALTQDQEMGEGSNRISQLEDRLNQLETQVQHSQSQQAQHNAHVTSQISQIKHHVDTQGVALQTHFDQRLQEQFEKIERLTMRKREGTE